MFHPSHVNYYIDVDADPKGNIYYKVCNRHGDTIFQVANREHARRLRNLLLTEVKTN